MSAPTFWSPSSVRLSTAVAARSSVDAAAGDDAFLDRRARRVQRVLDAGLLLLQLDLGGRADLDDGHAAGQLGQALLELLAVVVAGGLVDLDLDLADAALDVVLRCRGPRRWSCRPWSTRRGAPGPGRPAWRLSSFLPSSSLMTWPPVSVAMSRSISLRRSPKPGALTASTFRMPRSLLTTSVASASPSTSSAMMTSSLRPVCTSFSSTGTMSVIGADLLVGDQHVRLVERGFHARRSR